MRIRPGQGKSSMCGIAGIIATRPLADCGQLEKLVAGIAHRGMDDRGTYLSPGRNCALGHTRLAILDLSAAGHQPMVDDRTGNAIVFNGEIYNFASLRKECELAGCRFRSHSDTEVILALYQRHGTDCLDHLRGMFAFAIWDEQRQRLFFARDRIGKKPFHYAASSSGFVFCSELDPLARHPWTNRTMDMQALDFYLHLQYIPAPLSIYHGIRKLPPAHYGVIDASGLHIKPYWQIDYREKIEIDEDDALDAFEDKLSEAVRLRMVADIPVGALLSGGVDSSLIVALMAKHSAAPVHTFSVGFSEADFDESKYARQAAEICGTLHRPRELAMPDTAILPLLAIRYGEPYGDSSALPSFAVCAAARDELKVVLNGDGGDELMGGYPRYSLPDSTIRVAAWLSRHHPLPLIDQAKWLGHTAPFPFKKIWRLLLKHMLLPDAGPFSMYGSSRSDTFRHTLLCEPSLENNLSKWRAAWFQQARMASANPIDSMLWLDNHTYLPDDLLVKMDIASMHCGLETRSPFLDHELIEFCARLPVHFKVRGGVGKYLVKRLAERHFPRDFVHRKKMGFGIPLLRWLKGPMLPLVRDVLRDPETMTPLNHRLILQNLSGFETGTPGIHPARIWMLLMYGLWRRHCCPA
jgi:asparagine synthase (glutamine-hydrolysing)